MGHTFECCLCDEYLSTYEHGYPEQCAECASDMCEKCMQRDVHTRVAGKGDLCKRCFAQYNTDKRDDPTDHHLLSFVLKTRGIKRKDVVQEYNDAHPNTIYCFACNEHDDCEAVLSNKVTDVVIRDMIEVNYEYGYCCHCSETRLQRYCRNCNMFEKANTWVMCARRMGLCGKDVRRLVAEFILEDFLPAPRSGAGKK